MMLQGSAACASGQLLGCEVVTGEVVGRSKSNLADLLNEEKPRHLM